MSREKEETKMPDPMTTLIGGTEITVTKIDGSVEVVKVIQVPIKLFPKYAEALEDEPKLVALITGKDQAWVDSLTHESFEAVISTGEALNKDFFGRWLQRRLERQERMFPGVTQKMIDAVAGKAAAAVSQ